MYKPPDGTHSSRRFHSPLKTRFAVLVLPQPRLAPRTVEPFPAPMPSRPSSCMMPSSIQPRKTSSLPYECTFSSVLHLFPLRNTASSTSALHQHPTIARLEPLRSNCSTPSAACPRRHSYTPLSTAPVGYSTYLNEVIMRVSRCWNITCALETTRGPRS